MVNQPTVDRDKIIDTYLNKPAELINQRFFNNVDVSEGWRESEDGLFSYSKDIRLDEQIDTYGESARPIDLSYSPFITVPNNANISCDRSNFPYAKTIDTNLVRLYAYRIPDPNDMSLITIVMNQVNTAEGGTNAGERPDPSANLERHTVQVRNEHFLVHIKDDNTIVEQERIEIVVNGFKGTEKKKVRFGRKVDSSEGFDTQEEAEFNELFNIDQSIFRNMNGTPISLDGIEITSREEGLTAVLEIVLPQGLELKDKRAYFVIPVLIENSNQMFFIRATLNTQKSDKPVEPEYSYRLYFPKLTRAGSYPNFYYYQNGELVTSLGVPVRATQTDINGVSTAATGKVKIFDGKTEELLDSFNTGSNWMDQGTINNSDSLLVTFSVKESTEYGEEYVERYRTRTDVSLGESKIIIDPIPNSLFVKITGDKYALPEFTVNVSSINKDGFSEPYYSTIVIKNQDGKPLPISPINTGDSEDSRIAVVKNGYKLTIPYATYTGSTLPSAYIIEVYDMADEWEDDYDKVYAPGEKPIPYIASESVGIYREGSGESPYYLELNPNSLTIQTDRNSAMKESEYHFSAIVRQDALDVSNEWDFEVIYESNPSEVSWLQGGDEGFPDGLKNEFMIISFRGTFPKATLTIKATKDDMYLIKHIELERMERQDTIFSIEGLDIIKGFVNDADAGMTFDPESIILSVAAQGEVYPKGVNWQYKNISPTNTNPDDEANDLWKNFSDLADQYENNYGKDRFISVVPFPGLFNDNGVATIRAEVDTILTEQGKSFKKYSINHNIHLLHMESTQYFSKLISRNSNQDSAHIFLVDKYGNPLQGTAETGDAIYFEGSVVRGMEELSYTESDDEKGRKGFYYISKTDYLNCSIDIREKAKVSGKKTFIGSFNSISGSSGRVKLTLNLEGKKDVDVYFNWEVNVIESNKTRRVSLNSTDTKFIIQDATFNDILTSNIFTKEYTEKFMASNEAIKVFLSTEDTNVSSISLSKDGLTYEDLNSNLIYKNNQERRFLPMNILSAITKKTIEGVEAKEQKGIVVPREYYLLSFFGSAINNQIKYYYSRRDAMVELQEQSFEASSFFTFNGREAIIIQAPNGSEEIRVDLGQGTEGIEMFLIELLEDSDVVYDFQKSELQVSEELPLPVSYSNYYEESTNYFRRPIIKNSIEYVREDWNKREYLEIQPNIATNLTYFAKTPADASITIKAESVTGELDLLKLYREVRPFKETNLAISRIEEIVAGEFLDKSDLRLILHSRDLVAKKVKEIRELIEPDYSSRDYTIPIAAKSPNLVEINYLHDLVEKVEGGERFTASKLKLDIEDYGEIPLDEQGEPILEGFNPNSIFGAGLNDDSYYFLEYEIKYDLPAGILSKQTAEFTFAQANNKDASKHTFVEGIPFNKWVKFLFVIPPSNQKINLNEEITNYLRDYNIALDSELQDLRVMFNSNQRSNSETKIAPYFMYLNFPNKVEDKIFLRNVKLQELNLASEEKIKTYETLANSDDYLNLITSSDLYLSKIQNLENSFNAAEEIGDLPLPLLLKRQEEQTIDGELQTVTVVVHDYRDIYDQLLRVEYDASEVEYLMNLEDRIEEENLRFEVEKTNKMFAIGFQNSSGWLSSLRITPEGTVIQGEKNKIVGSTSIGSLYGKKVVIGKNPGEADFEYDQRYRLETGQSEGILAVWDATKNVWSSVLDKTGQYFLRYEEEDEQIGLVGYMVMNPSEIAAYQFEKITDGLSGPDPYNVNKQIINDNKYPVFKIGHSGSVEINNLMVTKTSESIPASLDFMDTIRVEHFESDSLEKKRRGIVFIGITGGKEND